MDRRSKNIEIFEDTMRQCGENRILQESIRSSIEQQKVYTETDFLEEIVNEKRYEDQAKVIVSKKRSFEAASHYVRKKVCVHNFASATNPGGGVVHGSNAQEECLCRCSTLYPALRAENVIYQFYNRHRQLLQENQMTALYNDDCIYTPEITVFKSDIDFPELLSEEKWYKVDVLTMAAPNLREKPSNRMNPHSGEKATIGEIELKELHKKRMSRLFEVSKRNGVEVLILGAFGCGAFCNPPKCVAEAMKEVIETYIYDFEAIEFAVYCLPRSDENYRTFCKVFGQ